MTRPNNALIERLRARMEEKGLNAREIAERAKVGRSFIYDILSGKSANPTTSKLVSVAKVLEISLPYLMEGESYLSAANGNSETPLIVVVRGLQVLRNGDAAVVTENHDDAHYFSNQWIMERLKSAPEQLGVVAVKGDSMKPTLLPGDTLLIDRSQIVPSPPGIFLLYDGIGLVTKRLEYLSRSHPSMVCVSSDNPQYRNYERPLDELQIVGRVVWFGREMG